MSKQAGKVAKRYARALLASYQASQLDTVDESLKALAKLWEESEELRTTLKNPAFNLNQRSDAWSELAKRVRSGDQQFLNFCLVLLQRGRLDDLPAISDAFSSLILELKNLLSVRVTSAFPLAEDEKRSFQESLQHEFGSLASLEWNVDGSLLGGTKVQVGDRLLDTSVRGALDRLKADLIPA